MSGLESIVIDINKDNNSGKEFNLGNKPSVNFGGGIELLMNEKKKGGSSGELGITELSDLENELNDLSTDIGKKTLENSRSSIFNSAINSVTTDQKGPSEVRFNTNIDDKEPDLGQATASNLNSSGSNKTWDGYGKFNNVPVSSVEQQELNKEELIREKFKYLRRLEELERKGATLTKKYSMDSPLEELMGEYEMILAEKEKSNSVKFQGKMLMAAITGIEFLNNRFDPFDLKMDGWAEQINENITDYDEIFGELHEKYRSKAKMAPELKLLFQLGGSAIMVHMTNTMFKSSMPGMDDIMKQNPELMQQFTQAAVNNMGESNPGFGNFMNNFMPGSANNMTPPEPTNMGHPPPPVDTQVNKSQRYEPPKNRPDLMASRTQEGISIQEKFASVNKQEPINPPQANRSSNRQEMKGPSDLTNILSGLKTKEVNVPTKPPSEKNLSTISIQDLKEMSNQKLPKSNRKSKGNSAKNTISLDL
jgi:hypothetical protein